MNYSEDKISPPTIWRLGLGTLKGLGSRAVFITFGFIALPQIVFEMFFSMKSLSLSQDIRKNTGDFTDRGIDFLDFFNPAGSFLSSYIAMSFVLGIVYLCTYFSLLHLAVEYIKARPSPSVWSALLHGAKKCLPKGLLAIFFFMCLLITVQIILPPTVIFLLPGIMIPVLLEVEEGGVFRSLRDGLSLRYGRNFPGGVISLFFQIVSIGAFFYIGVILSFYFQDFVLNLDLYFDSAYGLVHAQFFSFPFSVVFFAAYAIKICIISVLVLVLACYSVTLYYWIKSKQTPVGRHGISV